MLVYAWGRQDTPKAINTHLEVEYSKYFGLPSLFGLGLSTKTWTSKDMVVLDNQPSKQLSIDDLLEKLRVN